MTEKLAMKILPQSDKGVRPDEEKGSDQRGA